MSETLLTFTDDTFETDVVASPTPTLVDFWAQWCAPCKALTPVIEQIAERFSGRLRVGKIDIDDNQKTPSHYSVRAIPTLILFKDGKVADQIVGFVTQSKIEAMISKHIEDASAEAS